MQRSVYIALIFTGFILLEMVFVALSTGYMSIQVKSTLLENPGFFIELARDDFFTSLKYVFIENPLFIIQSQHRPTASVVWSLHYYGLGLLVHLGLASVLAEMRLRYGPTFKYEALPLAGATLIVVCSLYLFLGSCCTGGPNWIVQTWLLAVVFNPITSSNATIQLYQSIKDTFFVVQLFTGITGAYLLYRYYRKRA